MRTHPDRAARPEIDVTLIRQPACIDQVLASGHIALLRTGTAQTRASPLHGDELRAEPLSQPMSRSQKRRICRPSPTTTRRRRLRRRGARPRRHEQPLPICASVKTHSHAAQDTSQARAMQANHSAYAPRPIAQTKQQENAGKSASQKKAEQKAAKEKKNEKKSFG